MSGTLRLTDEELQELAWRAVRRFFPADQLEQATIELEHTVWSTQSSETGQFDSGEVVGVWLSHHNATSLPDPDATAAATGQMIQEADQKGDPRLLLLYHKFPNADLKRKRVA
jgi:hypothetical protein